MLRLLARILDLRASTVAERRATFWTGATFFCVLASYYMLRPLREQIGVADGIEELPRLYNLTLVTVLVFTPLYWALANRLPSRRFLPIAFHFFAANMVLFSALFQLLPGDGDRLHSVAGDSYWAWLSAFNVFAVSLVWIHAVEHFNSAQGKRLFGLIGVGGTLGAVCGSATTGLLVDEELANLDPVWLPLIAAVLMELAFVCYLRSARACRSMAHSGQEAAGQEQQPEVARGGIFRGLVLVFQSPYLRAISVYMIMLSLVGTAIYFRRNEVVEASTEGRQAQTGLFAWMDFCGQTLVLALQLFFTGRILRVFGLSLALCVLPLVSGTGLLLLGMLPSLGVVFALEVARRGTRFAIDKPAREVLYTPLGREEKLKSKAFLDAFVFRLGDSLGAWIQAGLRREKIALGGLTWVTVLMALWWAMVGWFLGRRHRRLAPESGSDTSNPLRDSATT